MKNRRRFGLGSGPSGCSKARSRWGRARRASRENFLGDGASLALASVILALEAGPSGFPKQLSGRRPKLPRQTRAVARALSVILALGAGPSCDRLPRARFRRFGAGGWLPESGGILDEGHGQPAPSHARAPLFWRLGLARRASRNNFPGEASATAMANPRRRSRTLRYFGAGGLARRASRNKFPSEAQILKGEAAMAVFSTSVQMARFLASPLAVLSKPASIHSGRVIKARPVAAMAVLSLRSGHVARSPISYCAVSPAQAVYQRPSRAIFRKGWQSERQLYQGPPAAVAVLSKPMPVSPRAAMAVLSIRSGQMAFVRFGLRMADFILPRVRSLSAAKPRQFRV